MMGMFYIIKQQSRQIELQKEILKKERETVKAYQSFVDKYDENQRIFNKSIDKISIQQEKITREYDENEERISQVFKKTDWDESLIPDDVYCILKRMHKTGSFDDNITGCKLSTINTTEFPNELRSAKLKRQ